MSLSHTISHGDVSMAVLEVDDVAIDLYGLDQGSMVYFSSNPDAIVAGQFDPTYPGLQIERLHRRRDGDIWTFDAQCKGIKGNKTERHLPGSPDAVEDAANWDKVSVRMITNNRNRFAVGQIASGSGVPAVALACMGWNPKPLDGHSGWYEGTASLMGLIKAKAGTRTITATGRTISGDNIKWPFQPGWNTFHAGEVEITGVTVVDEDFDTFPPPTSETPGERTPPNAPSIKVFNVPITDAREYWPNGWRFYPSGQQLVKGVSLWKNTRTYVYTPRYLPK